MGNIKAAQRTPKQPPPVKSKSNSSEHVSTDECSGERISAKQYLIGRFKGRDESQRVNLGAFDPNSDNKNWKNPTLKEIRETDFVQKFISKHNGWNIHYGVNLCKRIPKNGKAAKEDLGPIWYVHADIDPPKDAPDDFDREAWKRSTIKELQAYGLPMSIVDSGGGVHATIEMDKPLKQGVAEKINRYLIAEFGGDSAACDVSRLLRIPGTMNVKRDRNVPCKLIAQTQISLGVKRFECLFYVEGLPIKDKWKDRLLHDRGDNPSKLRMSVMLTLPEDLRAEFIARSDLHSTPENKDKLKNPKWSARELESAAKKYKKLPNNHILRLNEKYFVTMFEGRFVVLQEKFDKVRNRHRYVFTSKKSLLDMHANKLVKVKKKWINPVEHWWRHKSRHEYTEMLLRPDLPPGPMEDGSLNMWKGWTVESRAGDCSLFDELLDDVICSNDEQREYAWSWLARMIQFPEKVGEVAFVMQGGKGTGKGTLARAVGNLFNDNYLRISQPQHLTGRFNDHFLNCVFLFADEALWAGDKRAEGALKSMITEQDLTIEPKHMPVTNVPNLLHIMMASNERWVVPASDDERRFFVVRLNDKRQKDYKFFGKLWNQMKDGGSSALLHKLLNRDISMFRVQDVPSTEALEAQQEESLDDFMAFWLDEILDGGHGNRIFDWDKVSTVYLFERYRSHQRRRTVKHGGPNSQQAFGKRLSEVLPEGWPKQGSRMDWSVGQFEVAQSNSYILPPLSTCRRSFDEYIGRSHDWPEIRTDVSDPEEEKAEF